MKYLLFIAGLSLVALWIYRLVKSHRHEPLGMFFFPALASKLLAGVALGIVFLFRDQGGDTWNLFIASSRLTEIAFEDWGTYLNMLLHGPAADTPQVYFTHHLSTVYFIDLLSIINFFTLSTYWLTGLVLSLFSFQFTWMFANRLALYIDDLAVVIAFFFFPSIVFWSSGIMKEAVALGLITGMGYLALPQLTRTGTLKIKQLALLVLAGWLLYWLKYYYVVVLTAIMVPTFLVAVLVDKIGRPTKFWGQIALWALLLVVFFILGSFSQYNLNPARILDVIVATHDKLVLVSDPNSLIHYDELAPTTISFLVNTPTALFAGLFRPGVWEIHHVAIVLPAIENLMLLLLSITWVYGYKSFNGKNLLSWAVLLYVLLIATLLAMATPNLGSLARYKVAYLPFFVVLLCHQHPSCKNGANVLLT